MSVLALVGCGNDSPEGAVKQYYSAWEEGNWAKYKEVHAPEQRELNKEQEELAKQKFEQIEVKFDDLKMETTYDEKDKNRATVTLVSGKATYTAIVLGEKKTDTQDISKMKKEERLVLPMVKVNGKWYVDKPPG